MEITKIVVGIDFSPESEAAIAHAMSVARHAGAELVLVHVGVVLDADRSRADGEAAREWERIVGAQLSEDRTRLEATRERLYGQGVDVSHMVIDGLPDSGLCEAAESLGADLVVVGTHGRTGVKRFLLGSVAERVVRDCDATVMVARDHVKVGGYKHILVPTDFSSYAERALELALVLAAPGATVDVFHCWNLPAMAAPYYAPAAVAETVVGPLRGEIDKDSRERGEALIAAHGRPDIELTFHTVEANAPYGINDRVVGEGADYDLVVMGSHGRRGVRRFLLGSVAERTVRHSPCSVVVVHERRDS